MMFEQPCSAGTQCSVEVPATEQFVEGCNVASVVLSSFRSARQQHQRFSTSDDTIRTGSDTSTNPEAPTSPRQSVGHGTTDGNPREFSKSNSETRRHWRPLLLVIPLRLGLSEINPIYFSAIKVRHG